MDSRISSNNWEAQIFSEYRLGVGEKPEGWDLADYVLFHMSAQEQKEMGEAVASRGGSGGLRGTGGYPESNESFQYAAAKVRSDKAAGER